MQVFARLMFLAAFFGLLAGCRDTPVTASSVKEAVDVAPTDGYYAVDLAASVNVTQNFAPPTPPTSIASLLCNLTDFSSGLSCREKSNQTYLGLVVSDGKAILTRYAHPPTPPKVFAKQTCKNGQDSALICTSKKAGDGSYYTTVVTLKALAQKHFSPPSPPEPAVNMICAVPAVRGTLSCNEVTRSSDDGSYLGVEFVGGSYAVLKRFFSPPNPPQALARLNCKVGETANIRCL